MRVLTYLFAQRVRGFRLIEVIGIFLAVAFFIWVTISKALVDDDIERLKAVSQQIEAEQLKLSQLRVRVASLERPERLEALAKRQLGMEPLDPKREASFESLAEISAQGAEPQKHKPQEPVSAELRTLEKTQSQSQAENSPPQSLATPNVSIPAQSKSVPLTTKVPVPVTLTTGILTSDKQRP